ncbi:efflux RND transporter permease subunit [Desulfoprunum benzoelyticum]|uniref:Multidrug efflux pump n=1 Tax=Desulfoprunum benzoelyticum TaxID=1506996 RepID=A0A840URZ5_9BACT|nr:efflux RND transporter permease subunit [Desulfoprunum benzoelyticum]MBB5347443.1 multidrug efflux pump [Desulfoprunum benzoelyticum]MBM9529678.1 efflux RND transporter permease subunit [Desulfoprunum benzoelyticum]
MARYFIDRPIFAWVIAIVIMLAGALAVVELPISQYPEIAPPSVRITTRYTGASAETIENSVTQIIEQNLTGLDNFLYMKSESSSTGNVTITLFFEAGTDPDIAQVQVQNKLQQALKLLPDAVQKEGVQVAKSNSTFLMIVGLISSDPTVKNYDLADFMVNTLRDPLSRTPGVGTIQVFGGQYAMRIWLDPGKLNSFQLTPTDVANAIRAQNNQVAVGELGGSPSVPDQQLSYSMMAQTMMSSPEQFSQIMLRVLPDGSQVRLKDVARVEIGAENYFAETTFNGQTSSGMAIMLATGANALATSDAVHAKIKELKPYFPPGVEVIFPYDTTTFIRISIKEVVKTLVEAIILVFLVMYLFLQNFRATLIPTIAVPVVLLGTFAIMALFGFSINTLTMFGLVLAIGLLVDDAIVVVENVERIMAEEGLSPLEATRKSMDQITGALIGIALVLSAVFVPMAFFGGSTGAIYRQFSLTIVSAMLLSVLVALILTPALCATLLKPVTKGHNLEKRGFFGWFNRTFEGGADTYRNCVGYVLKRTGRFSIIYLAMIFVVGWFFVKLPTSFIPEEDQGVFLTLVQLPTGATIERTQGVLDRVRDHYQAAEEENIDGVFTVAGFSFAGMGQNMGMAFVDLKHWDERTRPDQEVKAIIGRAMGTFSQIKEAMVFPFNIPPIPALGTSTGFDFFLQDRSGLGHDKLVEARNQLLGMAAQNPSLTRVRPNGMEDAPEYNVDVDYEKAMALGVTVSDINTTLGTAWGSMYVNDFLNQGRVKKVYVQADAPFRMNPEDLNLWYVRNDRGEMVPFSAFASGYWSYGSPRLERYNGNPAINIVGEAAPGLSSGDAMKTIGELVAQLPPGFGYEWTGASFQEMRAGTQAPFLYAISILVVFLCLAALYESWSVPFSVILAVPIGVLGALAAVYTRGLTNDVYFQVGLLTTIGLSAKNAILIVEFAKRRYDRGRDLVDSALRAARQRLRPILMTSLAFMLGVLPLAISTGAGANSRHAIGTGVLGGMTLATVLAILFIPLFFVVVLRIFKPRRREADSSSAVTKE